MSFPMGGLVERAVYRGAQMTYVTTAVQDDANNLALLHFRQLKLRKSFAGIDVVLNSSISPLPLLQE